MDLGRMRILDGCAGRWLFRSSAPSKPPPPVVAKHETPSDAPTDHRRWLAGDLHMHVAPPDSDDVTASIADITKAATRRGHGLHRAHAARVEHAVGASIAHEVQPRGVTFAKDARAVTALDADPGDRVDDRARSLRRSPVPTSRRSTRATSSNAAHAAGAFISVNHPFAVPTHVPNVRISDFNMSYRVWTERATGFTAIDSAEVFNVPLAFANVFVRPGGHTGEERTWTELDRVVHEEHRPVTRGRRHRRSSRSRARDDLGARRRHERSHRSSRRCAAA